MRRIPAPIVIAVLVLQSLLPAIPAKAAVNIEEYRSAVITDLNELHDYFQSNRQWMESTVRGIDSPTGVQSYFETLVADADGMSHPKFNETQPGDSLDAKSTITYWYQACKYLSYMVSESDPWDPALDNWGAINIKLRDAFKDYIALENERIKKDPNWDSRHAWYSGSNSEKEPGFFLSRAFAMTMGYVKLYDRDADVIFDGQKYGANNPCLAASGDIAVVYYQSIGRTLVDKTIPWGGGPLTSEVRLLGKQDAIPISRPEDSNCWYTSACQPALKTTYVGSPSGSGDLNFIAYLKSYANTLQIAQKYWREELAKLRDAKPDNSIPIVGNVGGSVISLPLPLSNITVAGAIGRVTNAIMGIVGAVALLLFVWGGIRWMLARGNTDEIGKAKKTIVWAALGLVAIFSSYAILSFVINALQ